MHRRRVHSSITSNPLLSSISAPDSVPTSRVAKPSGTHRPPRVTTETAPPPPTPRATPGRGARRRATTKKRLHDQIPPFSSRSLPPVAVDVARDVSPPRVPSARTRRVETDFFPSSLRPRARRRFDPTDPSVVFPPIRTIARRPRPALHSTAHRTFSTRMSSHAPVAGSPRPRGVSTPRPPVRARSRARARRIDDERSRGRTRALRARCRPSRRRRGRSTASAFACAVVETTEIRVGRARYFQRVFGGGFTLFPARIRGWVYSMIYTHARSRATAGKPGRPTAGIHSCERRGVVWRVVSRRGRQGGYFQENEGDEGFVGRDSTLGGLGKAKYPRHRYFLEPMKTSFG